MSENERHFTPAASRIGITISEYLEHRGRGLKWCCGVGKHWEPISGFNRNASSWDGIAYECRKCEVLRPANRNCYRQRRATVGNPLSQ